MDKGDGMRVRWSGYPGTAHSPMVSVLHLSTYIWYNYG